MVLSCEWGGVGVKTPGGCPLRDRSWRGIAPRNKQLGLEDGLAAWPGRCARLGGRRDRSVGGSHRCCMFCPRLLGRVECLLGMKEKVRVLNLLSDTRRALERWL